MVKRRYLNDEEIIEQGLTKQDLKKGHSRGYIRHKNEVYLNKKKRLAITAYSYRNKGECIKSPKYSFAETCKEYKLYSKLEHEKRYTKLFSEIENDYEVEKESEKNKYPYDDSWDYYVAGQDNEGNSYADYAEDWRAKGLLLSR